MTANMCQAAMVQHTVWRLPVARWVGVGCAPLAEPDTLDLGFIEPLLRRRLSPLARAALHAAHACSQHCHSVRMVYASRHGELGRTVETLYNLAREEVLSPTAFSLSVLNSAAGIFSIARSDTAPATAISAGTETFGFGLLEASTRASLDPSTPVLYVYADAAPPAPIGALPGDPMQPLALAMLIDGNCDEVLEVRMSPETGSASNTPQAVSCFHALTGSKSEWSSAHRQWQWEMQRR
ncbi:hypothetical protein EGT07_00230 [Herbaspirillum sp. HC18]|nr:hypothetical protein EGT07_00230 [Herbaspirillum sp. HC18]